MRVKIEAGAEFETMTPEELTRELDRRDNARVFEGRGVKLRRMPPMRGVVAGGAVSFGGDTGQQGGQQYGPSEGNTWVFRLITINGLAAGNPTDLLNLQIYGAGSGPLGGASNWWQFSGNNYAYTFGMFELYINPGEYLGFASQGAITAAAGSVITAQGNLLQVPTELVYRLLGGGR